MKLGRKGAIVGLLVGLAIAVAAPPTLARHRSVASRACPTAYLSVSDVSQIRSSLFCLVNRERVKRGIRALRRNGKLQAAAQGHTDDMIAADYVEHISPAGSTPLDRIRAAGYLRGGYGWSVAENIAVADGAPTAAQLLAAWMAEAQHRGNLLDPAYRDTGFGVSVSLPALLDEGSSGLTVTEDFGVRGHTH